MFLRSESQVSDGGETAPRRRVDGVELSKWSADWIRVGMGKWDNGRAPLWPAEASRRDGDSGQGVGHHDVLIQMAITGTEGDGEDDDPARLSS